MTYPTWLDRKARTEMLRSVVPHNAVCAEIGVFRGAFAKAILDLTEPRMLFLIDKWGQMPAMYEKGDRLDMWAVHGQVLDDMRDHQLDGRVCILAADSVEAAAYFADATFDWVFLDTWHRLQQTRRELDAWLPKVKPGGLFCLHDYNLDGVRQAVEGFEAAGALERVDVVSSGPDEPPSYIGRVH